MTPKQQRHMSGATRRSHPLVPWHSPVFFLCFWLLPIFLCPSLCLILSFLCLCSAVLIDYSCLLWVCSAVLIDCSCLLWDRAGWLASLLPSLLWSGPIS